MQKYDPDRYSVSYDKYMYAACVKLLNKFDDSIMNFSRDSFVQRGPGAIIVKFGTITALVHGEVDRLEYITLTDLKQTCRKTIKWTTYDRIDFNREMIICVQCVDVNSEYLWHTMAFQDEPGPKDTAPLAKYFTDKTKELCYTCRRTGDETRIYKCRKCGVYMWYCGDRCRKADARHHDAFCNVVQ